MKKILIFFNNSSAQPDTSPVSRVQWPVSRTHSSVTAQPTVTTEVTKTLRTPDVPTPWSVSLKPVQVSPTYIISYALFT